MSQKERKITVGFTSIYQNATLESHAFLNLDDGQIELIEDGLDNGDWMLMGNLKKEFIVVDINGKVETYNAYVKTPAEGIAYIQEEDLAKVRENIISFVKKSKLRS